MSSSEGFEATRPGQLKAAQDYACAPSRPDHIVQFYENEDFLCDTVASFLGEGLMAGEPLVVIATPSHSHGFLARLKARGFDVDYARCSGQVTLLDARQTLSSFMIDRIPDEHLFKINIGGALERAVRGRNQTCIRTYGEMVDLLWQDKNAEAAIRLEELWNEMGRTHSFSLFCAYAMGNFHRAEHAQQFQQICHTHVHVNPSESYALADNEEARSREVSRLQQRAQALETEIACRKELEKALRDALGARRQAEAERERLLAAEQAARWAAEEANRLKDEFLAVLSHELRTPLNAILGWAHIVNDRRDGATVDRALEVINRNAKLQLDLIEGLLDVSRIATGKMMLNLDDVDLEAVLKAAADSVRHAAVAKGIAFDLRIDESARFVTGDSSRLQQVILSLLSNAIKFTPQNGEIELGLERAGAHARIVVRDTGQGIAAEFLPHVFERFRQADTSTTRRHGGLGVGLAVVRYVVEAHRGTVSAASAGAGLGSTFTVTLPLRADNAVMEQSVSARLMTVD
jgi:signal transduction histidine kinase